MEIPKHLLLPDMPEEHRIRVVAYVKACRKALNDSPSFDTIDAAVEAAIKMENAEKYSIPSVWKQPQDMGTKYTVVHVSLREKAQNAGYIEEVDEQAIADLVNGITREKCEENICEHVNLTENTHDVDAWTSNGYGLILNGMSVNPPNES